MHRPDDIGSEKYVRCGFRDCYKCCLETEMILTKEDVARIEKNTNFNREDFLLPTEQTDGFMQLKNVESPIGRKCFFLSDKGKCTIYESAPSGCKLYPLILNLETDEVMIDIDCRERAWFNDQTYMHEQVVSVRILVNSLLLENDEMEDL